MGVTSPAAVVKTEKDPNAPPKPDDLRDMRLRTFSTLKRLHDKSVLKKTRGGVEKGGRHPVCHGVRGNIARASVGSSLDHAYHLSLTLT